MEKINLISIYCGAVLLLFMGIFHTQFYKLFGWKNDFEKVSKINKNILFTIHIALTLLFLGLSAFTFIYAGDLSTSIGISFGFNIIFSLFWLWRTVWQIFYFKPHKKNKNHILHYVLIIYFALLFLAFIIPPVSKIL